MCSGMRHTTRLKNVRATRCSLFTVRESATSFHRMNISVYLLREPHPAVAVQQEGQARPKTRTTSGAAVWLAPRKGYTRDAERSLFSAAAREGPKLRQIDLHATCSITASFLDWARWLHGVLIPHRGEKPTLIGGAHQATTWPTSCSCVSRYSFACRPAHLSVWLVVASADACRVLNCGRTLNIIWTVSAGTSFGVRISSQTTHRDTDKSSASHLCKLMINDQTDKRLALAKP